MQIANIRNSVINLPDAFQLKKTLPNANKIGGAVNKLVIRIDVSAR